MMKLSLPNLITLTVLDLSIVNNLHMKKCRLFISLLFIFFSNNFFSNTEVLSSYNDSLIISNDSSSKPDEHIIVFDGALIYAESNVEHEITSRINLKKNTSRKKTYFKTKTLVVAKKYLRNTSKINQNKGEIFQIQTPLQKISYVGSFLSSQAILYSQYSSSKLLSTIPQKYFFQNPFSKNSTRKFQKNISEILWKMYFCTSLRAPPEMLYG